jgi:hypothetical protein
MGYKQLYQIACDFPDCTVTDTVVSGHPLPLMDQAFRNPVPEGWRKLRDTETDIFGTFCPGCSALMSGKQDLSGLTPLGSCPHCSASVYRTPSGLACTNGHGGWVSEELAAVFDNVRGAQSTGYAAVPFTEGANAEPFQELARAAVAAQTAEVIEGVQATGLEVLRDEGDLPPTDEPEEATLQEAIPEGDMVYALYTDGRIFKKQFHDDSCAKVAAQQLYDIPIEPHKMVTWYQWELCESVEEAPA